MAKLIPNEVPSGVIDGVNKTYLFLNDIDEMVTLVFDGAEYTNFVVDSVNKKQVTLVDAPTVSIYADYYAITDQVTEDSDITFGNIKTEVWGLLGQKSTSTTFSDTVVGDKINNTARQILKGRVKNLLNPNQTFRAGNLWFLENKTNIRIQAGSKLSAELSVGDVTADCSTSDLLTAGYVEIGGDIVSYTGVSATQLLGVIGQTVNHLVGEDVIQLYEMPVTLDKPAKVYKIVGEKTYEIPLYTGQETIYYKILRTGTKVLLKIVGLEDDDLVSVEYKTKFSNMASDATINPLPETYGISVLAHLTAGVLAYEKLLPIAERILNVAYGNLQVMYQDYTNETVVIRQSIKPRSYKFNSLRSR